MTIELKTFLEAINSAARQEGDRKMLYWHEPLPTEIKDEFPNELSGSFGRLFGVEIQLKPLYQIGTKVAITE